MQVTWAPGAKLAAAAGHDTADRVPDPENAVSFTDTDANVTFPVFVTTKLYVIVWPTFMAVPALFDFTIDSDGDWATDTVAVDGGDVTELPDGVVPDADAVLVIFPAFTSAWVVT